VKYQYFGKATYQQMHNITGREMDQHRLLPRNQSAKIIANKHTDARRAASE
jgi:hypothetical protein